jgi:hypothetical protein
VDNLAVSLLFVVSESAENMLASFVKFSSLKLSNLSSTPTDNRATSQYNLIGRTIVDGERSLCFVTSSP